MVCGLFALSGCQSNHTVVASAYTPTVIVSIHGNYSVPWFIPENEKSSEDDGATGGALTKMVNSALGKNDPEIQTAPERIDKAAVTFCHALEDKAGYTIIDKSRIKDLQIMKSSLPFFSDLDMEIPAEGYVALSAGGAKRNKEIARETGAKSTMFVQFTFNKQKIVGSSRKPCVVGRVTMHVYLADENGKKIVDEQYVATATPEIVLVNSTYDKQLLCDCFDTAVEQVVDRFITAFCGDSSVAVQHETAVISPEEKTPIAVPLAVSKPSDEDSYSGIMTEPEIEEVTP